MQTPILSTSLIVFAISLMACSGQTKGKYPLGPCVGSLCLGEKISDAGPLACHPNSSAIAAVELRRCKPEQSIKFAGTTSKSVSVEFINSYMGRAAIEFPLDYCRPIKALLTEKLGAGKKKYFLPAGMEKADAQVGDFTAGHEWMTENGRLVLSTHDYRFNTSNSCWLQMDAEWVPGEISRAMKSDNSVKG